MEPHIKVMKMLMEKKDQIKKIEEDVYYGFKVTFNDNTSFTVMDLSK